MEMFAAKIAEALHEYFNPIEGFNYDATPEGAALVVINALREDMKEKDRLAAYGAFALRWAVNKNINAANLKEMLINHPYAKEHEN